MGLVGAVLTLGIVGLIAGLTMVVRGGQLVKSWPLFVVLVGLALPPAKVVVLEILRTLNL